MMESEQEAAVALLFACLLYPNKKLKEINSEHVSTILVSCTKWENASLDDLTLNSLSLQAQVGSIELIKQAAPFITDSFRETLFAMICELITSRRTIDKEQSEVVALTAVYLDIPVETMRMLLTTYLIRNRWNTPIATTLFK